jgi:hypothetical protein
VFHHWEIKFDLCFIPNIDTLTAEQRVLCMAYYKSKSPSYLIAKKSLWQNRLLEQLLEWLIVFLRLKRLMLKRT